MAVNPPAVHRRPDINQASYLFLPTFASFLLFLLATLSSPIITGLSIATLHSTEGSLSVGEWGWCASGVANVTSKCTTHGGYTTTSQIFTELPTALQNLADFSSAIPSSYHIASAVFHSLACFLIWGTACYALVAAGNWHNQRSTAHGNTRSAFALTFWSAVFMLIPWALDLGIVTRLHTHAKVLDGTTVRPGPAIWMEMVAFLLSASTSFLRVVKLKHLPRPPWTVEGMGGDFHNAMPPPMSAGLSPPDEHPPSWESLNLSSPTPRDEKNPSGSIHAVHQPSKLGQPGLAVAV